jgi:hypothetical protein
MPRSHGDPIIPSDQDAMLAKAARLALERSEALDEALHLQINAAVMKSRRSICRRSSRAC